MTAQRQSDRQSRGEVSERFVLQRPLPAVPAAAQLARMTARVACRAWRVPDLADRAALVVSELVGRVLRQLDGDRLTLRLMLSDRRLRLEVHVPTSVVPAASETPSDDDPGAALLREQCTGWGVEPYGDGTQMWAELAV